MPLNFLPMIFQLYTVAFGLQRTNRYEIRKECEGIFFGALYPIGLGLWVVGMVEAMECGRLDTTVAGMASKGLRSSIYQATQNNIGSTDVRIPRTPLFAIPVVSGCFLLIINILNL